MILYNSKSLFEKISSKPLISSIGSRNFNTKEASEFNIPDVSDWAIAFRPVINRSVLGLVKINNAEGSVFVVIKLKTSVDAGESTFEELS